MNTIIEKIRAEIKIRLSANGAFDEEGDSAWHYDQGLNDAYNYILSFLSDLEKEEKPTLQEQPVCEDVEEAAKAYADDTNPTDSFYEAFKEGALWMREQMMDEWLKDRDGCFWDGVEEGKKAMREQMMKEAVEGIVTTRSMAGNIVTAHIDHQFKDGQKVKIIIVKED